MSVCVCVLHETHLGDAVATEIQANQGGVARTCQHGVVEWAHGVGGQVQVSGIQGYRDRHGGARPQRSAVHPGQAEAVEQAKALHLTVAGRVTVPHWRASMAVHQHQRQAKPQQVCHFVLRK